MRSDLIVETSEKIHYGLTDWTQRWRMLAERSWVVRQGLRGGGADKQDGKWVSYTGCGLDLRQKPPNGSVPKEKVCG